MEPTGPQGPVLLGVPNKLSPPQIPRSGSIDARLLWENPRPGLCCLAVWTFLSHMLLQLQLGSPGRKRPGYYPIESWEHCGAFDGSPSKDLDPIFTSSEVSVSRLPWSYESRAFSQHC